MPDKILMDENFQQSNEVRELIKEWKIVVIELKNGTEFRAFSDAALSILENNRDKVKSIKKAAE